MNSPLGNQRPRTVGGGTSHLWNFEYGTAWWAARPLRFENIVLGYQLADTVCHRAGVPQWIGQGGWLDYKITCIVYYISTSFIRQIYSELEAIVDKLATESQRGSNTLRKQTSRSTHYYTVIPLLIIYISLSICAVNAIKTSSPVQSPVNKLNNANANNSNYQNQITTNGGSSLANSRK